MAVYSEPRANIDWGVIEQQTGQLNIYCAGNEQRARIDVWRAWRARSWWFVGAAWNDVLQYTNHVREWGEFDFWVNFLALHVVCCTGRNVRRFGKIAWFEADNLFRHRVSTIWSSNACTSHTNFNVDLTTTPADFAKRRLGGSEYL